MANRRLFWDEVKYELTLKLGADNANATPVRFLINKLLDRIEKLEEIVYRENSVDFIMKEKK